MPVSATLVYEPEVGLNLIYGPEECRIRLRVKDSRTLEYRLAATTTSGFPIAAHLTLIPHLNQTLETGSGQKITLGDSPLELTAEQVAGTVTYAGYLLHLPESATLHWPELPHNPYRKDGHATPAEGRIEIRIPFDEQNSAYTINVMILE